MQHYAPHPTAAFEGHYSKFSLPSGSSLALIICSVPRAPTRPHMLSFTYVTGSSSSSSSHIFQRQLWVSNIQRRLLPDGAGNHAFEFLIPGIGHSRTLSDSSTEYDIQTADIRFRARTTSRVPWAATGEEESTPEGWLVHLPLPLHWHVHSLSSECEFELSLPPTATAGLDPADQCGKAIVHQEKNWARSFPRAHIWLHAREGERGVCCAGGKVLGMEAYLLGYWAADARFSVEFRPPWALGAMGFAPCMAVRVDWATRSFEISVRSLRAKMDVRARAAEGSFFGLSAPFEEGHRENLLGQSFEAGVEVRVWERERGWWGAWRLVCEDRFEGGALEFGGEYYPARGEGKKYN